MLSVLIPLVLGVAIMVIVTTVFVSVLEQNSEQEAQSSIVQTQIVSRMYTNTD
jgi:sensor domain CHASE-containing protein